MYWCIGTRGAIVGASRTFVDVLLAGNPRVTRGAAIARITQHPRIGTNAPVLTGQRGAIIVVIDAATCAVAFVTVWTWATGETVSGCRHVRASCERRARLRLAPIGIHACAAIERKTGLAGACGRPGSIIAGGVLHAGRDGARGFANIV